MVKKFILRIIKLIVYVLYESLHEKLDIFSNFTLCVMAVFFKLPTDSRTSRQK